MRRQVRGHRLGDELGDRDPPPTFKVQPVTSLTFGSLRRSDAASSRYCSEVKRVGGMLKARLAH